MNERIKQLAEQSNAMYIPRYDVWQMDTETLNLFANLIIENIREIVWEYKDWCDEHPQLTTDDMAMQIDCEICEVFEVEWN